MQLPQDAPQFLQSEALIVVAAREEGIIYRLKNGEVEQVDVIEQHLLPLSDDEGFFFGGVKGGGGAPKERNDEEEYNKVLCKKIAHELDQLIKKENTRVLFLFEPEHLKGRIGAQLQRHDDLAIHNVRYGNYVHEPPKKIIDYITQYVEEHKIDLKDYDFDSDFKKY